MNSVPPAYGPSEGVRLDIASLQLVTANSGSSLALIVDHDLGFLMWLGDVFLEVGYQAVPALHCRQALALARRVNLPVSTLVVNPELPGAGRIVAALAELNPGLRVIQICNSAAHPDQANGNGRTKPNGIHARFTLQRPPPWEPVSRPEWVAKIRKMLPRTTADRPAVPWY
jgi:hypothetical protein